MKKITILHNSRCSKSRCALKILQDQNCDLEIIDYIKNIPSKKEIKNILDKLGLDAIDIVRKKEAIYLKKFKGKTFSSTEWIQILTEYPNRFEIQIFFEYFPKRINYLK